jgi:hypothetical protein
MRLALLILLLLPLTAHAAPVVAAVIIYASESAIVAQLLLLAVATVYGNIQKRRQEREARDKFNSSLQDRTVTNVATETPYLYVYGRARVGSSIIAIFTSGDKDQYKHLVCVHAAHECDAIEEIYINGKALGTLDADGYVTSGDYFDTSTEWFAADVSDLVYVLPYTPMDPSNISVTLTTASDSGYESVPYTYDAGTNSISITPPFYAVAPYRVGFWWVQSHPRVSVHKHLGTAGDPVDAYLHSILPTQWPTTATVHGFCYTVVTLDLNKPEFQTGIPPIEVLLRGKKLYDPRSDTAAWIQNPALAIYDYLTSELCGVDAADIPVDYLIAAANTCDESVASAEVYGELGPRYTLNGTVTSDQAQQDVLEKMAQAMAGGIASTTWEMWAGTYVAPVMALYVDRPGDMGDVVGQIAITPGVSDADLYNGVKGQYISGDNSYVATDFEPYQNSTYLAADEGVEKWTNIDFPFTDKKQRVWNLARIFTEDQRNGYTVRAEFSLKAWSLKIGQRITLTSTIFGWDAKVFRVIGKKFSPTMPVELTLKEDASSIWDFTDEALPDATPNTNLPNPFAIDMLASLTCVSGNDTLAALQDGTILARIKTSWPQTTTQAVFTNGLIEVEYQRAGDTTWQKTTVTGSDTESFLSPVEENRVYVVRARAVNPYFNVKSDWVYEFHRVVGKSARPPDVTGFGVSQLPDATRQFSWNVGDQPVDVLHGGGYLIKYRTAGDTTAWADMTPLHTGLITQSPFETGNPAAGSYDFAISSIDGSGNESLDAALVLDVVITDSGSAADALAAAEAAQASADAANNALANINSDSVLSAGEKPAVVVDLAEIVNSQANIDAQADAFAQDRTAYDASVLSLKTYLAGLTPAYDDFTQDTPIPQANYVDPAYWPTYYAGDNLRTRFNDVYLKRQELLNAIATETAKRATWDGVVAASGKLTTAGDVFNSGAVGTGDLADDAATDVIKVTATGVPVAFNSSSYTAVASISYTAGVSAFAVLKAKGTSTSASVASPASVAVASPMMKIIGSTGFVSQAVIPPPSFGATSSTPYNLDLSMYTAFQLTAGVTYTFDFELVANSNKYQCTVDSIEFVLEAVKR